MKKLLYLIFFILALYNSSGKGLWGTSLEYPGGIGGDDKNKKLNSWIAYGDSTFIFNGEWYEWYSSPSKIFYFIYYTLDGGKTWSKPVEFEEKGTFLGEQMNNYDLRLSSLNFFPPSTLQFTQYSTANVFRSTDWGATWTKTAPGIIKNPVGEFGVRTYALDSLRQIFNSYTYSSGYGYLYVGWAGKSYITYDGWETFYSVNLPKNRMDVQMVDDSNLVSMFWPNIYYSSNRGKTWDSVNIPGIKEDSIYRTYGGDFSIIPNSKTILFTGSRYLKSNNYGNIMTWKSTDAGKTWRIVLDTKDSLLYGGGQMSFNDKGVGLIVSGRACVEAHGSRRNASYISSDYGESWERIVIEAGASGYTYSCVSGSLKNMWALIDYKVYHYKPEPSGVIEIPDLPLASSCDVYPNPVGRGKTVYLPVNEGIAPGTSVKIYSLLGELIDEYIPEESTKLLSYRPDEKLVRGNYYFLIENLNRRIIKSFVVE